MVASLEDGWQYSNFLDNNMVKIVYAMFGITGKYLVFFTHVIQNMQKKI